MPELSEKDEVKYSVKYSITCVLRILIVSQQEINRKYQELLLYLNICISRYARFTSVLISNTSLINFIATFFPELTCVAEATSP